MDGHEEDGEPVLLARVHDPEGSAQRGATACKATPRSIAKLRKASRSCRRRDAFEDDIGVEDAIVVGAHDLENAAWVTTRTLLWEHSLDDHASRITNHEADEPAVSQLFIH